MKQKIISCRIVVMHQKNIKVYLYHIVIYRSTDTETIRNVKALFSLSLIVTKQNLETKALHTTPLLLLQFVLVFVSTTSLSVIYFVITKRVNSPRTYTFNFIYLADLVLKKYLILHC